jgi:hypothetical protein
VLHFSLFVSFFQVGVEESLIGKNLTLSISNLLFLFFLLNNWFVTNLLCRNLDWNLNAISWSSWLLNVDDSRHILFPRDFSFAEFLLICWVVHEIFPHVSVWIPWLICVSMVNPLLMMELSEVMLDLHVIVLSMLGEFSSNFSLEIENFILNLVIHSMLDELGKIVSLSVFHLVVEEISALV